MAQKRNSLLDFAKNNTARPIDRPTNRPRLRRGERRLNPFEVGDDQSQRDVTTAGVDDQLNKSPSLLDRQTYDGKQELDHDDYRADQGSINPKNDNQPHNHLFADPDRPLFDLYTVVLSVWHNKYVVLATGLIGALIAIMLALASPHTYYAQSQILLDPREIELTNSQIGNLQTSSQVVLALVDSQMEVFTSTPVLERVIGALDLEKNPEFNGSSHGQLLAVTTKADPRKNALDYLRENASTNRNDNTFIVEVGMESEDPELAARIADLMVAEALTEFSRQQSDFFDRASQSIGARLGQLKARLDSAEQAIVDYKSANDLIDVGGGVINDKEMQALSDELARVRAEQIAMSISADQLATASVSGVLSGAFPEAAIGATLVELRAQYATAKSSADALSVSLGPRHPTFIAAEKSVQAIESEVTNELRRIVSSTKENLARAERAEKELVAQLAVLETRASDQSSENVGLKALEREADSIRQIYLQLLNKSRETDAQSELSTINISVISQAEVPTKPASGSRKLTVIAGGVLGGVLGLAYAVLGGMWLSLHHNLMAQKKQSRSCVQQEPTGVKNPSQNHIRVQQHDPIPNINANIIPKIIPSQPIFAQHPPSQEMDIERARQEVRELRTKLEKWAGQRR